LYMTEAMTDRKQEGKTGRISLDDDDPDTVERMISYLYTLDYEDEEYPGARAKENLGLTPPALFSSIRVYAIADKYIIPALKELARERFSEWAESNWSHHDFPAMVREVCRSTPSSDRGLRDVVSRELAKHTVLLEKDDFFDPTELFGELGLEILRQVVSDRSSMEQQIKALEAEKSRLTPQGFGSPFGSGFGSGLAQGNPAPNSTLFGQRTF
jgi:hypothetical protein